jgi:ParB/RepB/Spo0J family partition protein
MQTVQDVPLTGLQPSPFNPRTTFDKAKMADLVASLRSGEIHEPIIGRQVDGHIEIVAGERRFRAAQEAKLSTVPVIVKELTDAQAMELQVIENEQREGVSDLDQAGGFQRLMALDPTVYTVKHLAERLGLKPASIYARLKLLEMIPEAQELMRAGAIETGHGVLIARLPAGDQKAIVKWLQAEAKQHRDGTFPAVRDLKEHIARFVKVDLFSPLVAEEQPAVAKKLADWKAKGIDPIRISKGYSTPDNDKTIKTAGDYREVGKKKCKSMKPAAFAYGDHVELTDVCLDKSCKVHWPDFVAQRSRQAAETRQAKESPAQAAKREAQAAQEKARKAREAAMAGAVLTRILEGTRAVSKPVLAELVSGMISTYPLVDFKTELEAAGLQPFLTGAVTAGAFQKATDRQLAQLAVLAVVGDRLRNELPAVAKAFGVNLAAVGKQASAAAKKAKPKPPAKLKAAAASTPAAPTKAKKPAKAKAKGTSRKKR